MLKLATLTGAFAIWPNLGLAVYFSYGHWNSRRRKKAAAGIVETMPSDLR